MKLKNLADKLLENWPAKIVCLTLSLLLFMFYRMSTLEQRVFSIPLKVQTNGDLVPAVPYPRTVTVRVRGEMDVLYPVEEKDISAFFDLSHLEHEGEFRIPIQVSISGSINHDEAFEIMVEPAEFVMRVENRAVKKVPVLPSFTGYPESGYEFDGYMINPVSVEVSGPRSFISKIDDMVTQPIDLSGRNANFEGFSGIVNRNPLITVSSGGTVEYRVIIINKIITRIFSDFDISVNGLDPHFSIETIIDPGRIEIRGKQIELEEWNITENALYINAKNIDRIGVYSLPVMVSLPEGFEAVNYSPQEVQLTVSRKPL